MIAEHEYAHAGSSATNSRQQTSGKKLDVIAMPVSYTHLRAHETVLDLVCRLLLEKKHTHTTNAIEPQIQEYEMTTKITTTSK